MSRKYLTNSGKTDILFDYRTKAVMAQPQQDGIKEKVQAVREVVLGHSNNEIVLVLQYYDYSVEHTIQAFVEDGAKAALEEWKFSGNKTKNNKARNNRKKKNKQKGPELKEETDHNANSTAAINNHTEIQDLENVHSEDENATRHEDTSVPMLDQPTMKHDISPQPQRQPKQVELQEKQVNLLSMVKSDDSKDAVSNKPIESKASARQDSPKRPLPKNNSRQESPRRLNRKSESRSDHRTQTQAIIQENTRERTTSECSTSSILSTSSVRHKGRFGGLEKSVKDLHRQTVSLERLKLIFGEEIDRSYKRIKSVFDLIRKELDEQESQLRTEVAQVKLAGDSILSSRQDKAVDLKVKTERAQTMADAQLSELKAEIKHFVSDRKIDEELCHATRFFHDSDPLLETIKTFSKVVPVRAAYSNRRPDLAADKTSHKTSSAYSMQTSLASGDMATMSASEIAELQQRLNKSLQLQGLPSKDKPRSPSRPLSSRKNPRSPSRPQSSPNRNNRNAPNPKSGSRSQGISSRSPKRPAPNSQNPVNVTQKNSQDSGKPEQPGTNPNIKGPEKRVNRNAQRRQRFRERRQREYEEDDVSGRGKSTATDSNENKGDKNNSPQRQLKQQTNDLQSKTAANVKENATGNDPRPQRQAKSPRRERSVPLKNVQNGTAQGEKIMLNGIDNSKIAVDKQDAKDKEVMQNGSTNIVLKKEMESMKDSVKTNGSILVNGDINHINGDVSH